MSNVSQSLKQRLQRLQELQEKSGNAFTLSGLLDFDIELFQSNPLTLGLLPDDITSVLSVLSERLQLDNHLLYRLECLFEQVEYAHSHPGIIDPTLFTPKTWGKEPFARYFDRGRDYPYINPKHWQEFVIDGGIDPTITLLNLQSFYHVRQVTDFLGYPCDSLGWVTWAVNPLTGLTDTTIATHFKPDTPITNSKGKKAKYLCPKSASTRKKINAVFPNVGEPTYWQEVLKSTRPIFLTEGSKKALSGLSHNLPTIALLGTWMGIEKVSNGVYELKESLKPFLQGNRDVCLAFDSDIIHKQSVYDAMLVTAQAIQQVPNFTGQVKVITWDYDPKTKGMDDYIKHEGIEKFRRLLESAYTLDAFIAEHEGKTSSSAVLERKQAIAKWSNASSLFEREYLEEGIRSKYGYSHATIEKLSNELESLNNPPKGSFFSTLDELVAEGIPDVEWLVDDYFARGGVSIIYGESGTGKSVFAYLLMIALAEGNTFLDKPVNGKFKSGIIQMDEGISSWGKKMRKLGIVSNDGKQVIAPHLKPYLNFKLASDGIWESNHTGLAMLEKWFESNPIDMVIIDNLKHIIPEGITLNDYDVETKVIKPLKRLAEKYNCHILVLHHTNKAGDYIGNTYIKASLIYMGHLYVKDNQRILQDKKHRDGDNNRTVGYSLAPNSENHWHIANVTENGVTSTVTEGTTDTKTTPKLTIHEKVIKAINAFEDQVHRKKREPGFTVADIVEIIGDIKPKSVSPIFTALRKEGAIVKGEGNDSPYTTTSLFLDKYHP